MAKNVGKNAVILAAVANSLFLVFLYLASDALTNTSIDRVSRVANKVVGGDIIEYSISLSGSSELALEDLEGGTIRLNSYYPLERRADFEFQAISGSSYNLVITEGLSGVQVFVEKMNSEIGLDESN